MNQVWPLATIRELLALAEANGQSKATLSSAEEARRFRFAIYTFRKNNNIGRDVSVTIDDKTVIVTRKPTVTILQSEEQEVT